MKKKILYRGLLGFPLGVFLGYVITIAISVVKGGGFYAPCAPELTIRIGSEIGAVALQAALCGLLGSACAMSSVIFEMERWGITKQTALHFLAISLSMLPIAYVSNWMERTFLGVLSYFAVFAGVYVVIWLVQYTVWRLQVKKINRKIHENRLP